MQLVKNYPWSYGFLLLQLWYSLIVGISVVQTWLQKSATGTFWSPCHPSLIWIQQFQQLNTDPTISAIPCIDSRVGQSGLRRLASYRVRCPARRPAHGHSEMKRTGLRIVVATDVTTFCNDGRAKHGIAEVLV